MKKTIIALLALLTVTVSASAYDLTVAKSEKGTVTFKVDGTAVTSAADGSTVSMTIVPNDGYVVTSVTNELTASWDLAKAPRRAGVDIISSVEMTKIDDNNYTFTMPKANVEVSVDYIISLVEADETEDPSKEVEDVKVEMTPVGPETTEGGQTVIPVAVESIEVPAQEAQTEVTVVVSGEIVVGNTRFVVKEIKADAFKTPADSKATVTKVVLPATEEAISVENGAMKPNGTLIEVETPLYLLDDYALMPAMKENFEQSKISAKATSPNKFWSFSSGVDVKLPEGLLAYRAYNDNGICRILLLDEVNEKKVIKANNGVLLACTNGQGGDNYSFTVNPGGQASGSTPATTDAKSYEGNQLVPTIVATNYESGRYLVLKDNQFHPLVPSTTSKVPACKAVLDLQKK